MSVYTPSPRKSLHQRRGNLLDCVWPPVRSGVSLRNFFNSDTSRFSSAVGTDALWIRRRRFDRGRFRCDSQEARRSSRRMTHDSDSRINSSLFFAVTNARPTQTGIHSNEATSRTIRSAVDETLENAVAATAAGHRIADCRKPIVYQTASARSAGRVRGASSKRSRSTNFERQVAVDAILTEIEGSRTGFDNVLHEAKVTSHIGQHPASVPVSRVRQPTRTLLCDEACLEGYHVRAISVVQHLICDPWATGTGLVFNFGNRSNRVLQRFVDMATPFALMPHQHGRHSSVTSNHPM